jgi:glyoxylase-like metal-dependent hydrolase (beta-lactamase superfamily II)
MVIITHGDYDHIGNCAFLREKFGTKIAMHKGDSGMAETGDMFKGRKNTNVIVKAIAPGMMSLLGLKSKKFKPDIYLKDGQGLSEYGLDARVIHIPGHSSGSIGILTADGSLFCGDLLENTKKPAFNSIMDDKKTASASVDKLKSLNVTMVYPGHGRSFTMKELISDK